jgi:hypothetical protein
MKLVSFVSLNVEFIAKDIFLRKILQWLTELKQKWHFSLNFVNHSKIFRKKILSFMIDLTIFLDQSLKKNNLIKKLANDK